MDPHAREVRQLRRQACGRSAELERTARHADKAVGLKIRTLLLSLAVDPTGIKQWNRDALRTFEDLPV
jgi:hypothetical protein